MDKPAIPEYEALRLQDLNDLSILDTPPEVRFDRLTGLAQTLFDVPIALVSLVDSQRQWFKSRQGLQVCETGRDISFCGHAILQPEIFEVSDASKDHRFADNPLVTGAPHIRFYAGAPLFSANGYGLGTLCIIDIKPRQLSGEQRKILRDLADAVAAELNGSSLQSLNTSLIQAKQLSDTISRAQQTFISEPDRRRAFDNLLADILKLTKSEYGFIGEVRYKADGAPYLKTYAITNIAWSDDTRAFYAANAPKGMEFYNLNTLFGAALTSGEPVIANAPYQDLRRGGLPEGHPAMHAFLGLPVHRHGKLNAMLGVANRPGGYDQSLINFLEPLLVTLGQLVEASQLQNKHAEAQHLLQLLSKVASQTTNGVVITNCAGEIEWINDGFTRITGYSLSEITGRKPGEVLQGPKTDPNTVKLMKAALLAEKPFDVEIINYHRDATPYWIQVQCSTLYDDNGTLKGFMAIESDITGRKKLEQIKNEFVSTVSHELRTPLTSLSGALDLVASGRLGPLNDATQQLILLAQNNGQRLKFLINDLLDIEKLSQGKLKFDLKVQQLQPLLHQAAENHKTYGFERHIDIVLELPAEAIQVRVDGQRLQQVLANLLSNAIKFSPHNSSVRLQVQMKGDKVRVSVADCGPGVPETFKSRIFERFSQADSSDTRKVGGTGLGLAICRELIMQMDGSIGFDSIDGQGATFWFEILAGY